MRRIGVWMLLVGCADPGRGPVDVPAQAQPVGGGLVLSLEDAWSGQGMAWSVSGGVPGVAVALGAGVSSGGPVCPAVLGGACLDLRRPYQVGAATFDAAGVASGVLAVPQVAVGVWWFQAATMAPASPQTSGLVVHEVWDGRADTDRDGLTDGDEAVVVGTDPFDPDGDDDLVLDGREVDLGTDPFVSDSDGDGIDDGFDLRPLDVDVPDAFVPQDVVVSDPTSSMPDPEFEEIDGQFVWQSNDGREGWTGHVDLMTGALVPTDGRGTLLSTELLPVSYAKNGPEWTYTDQGPMLVMALDDGAGNGILHVARPDAGGWDVQMMPGADTQVAGGPLGSLDVGDPHPRVAGPTLVQGRPAIGWREIFDASRGGIVPIDFWFTRWIVGEPIVLGLTLDAQGFAQIVAYDTDQEVLRWVTAFSGEHAHTAYGWRAPDLNDRLVIAIASGAERGRPTRLSLWINTPAGWTPYTDIPLPPAFPFVASPEPFVVDGRSYVTYMAQREPGTTTSEQIWVASIDPTSGLVRRVSGDADLKRRDPEPFTLGVRPWIYYSEIRGGSKRVIHRVETGL